MALAPSERSARGEASSAGTLARRRSCGPPVAASRASAADASSAAAICGTLTVHLHGCSVAIDHLQPHRSAAPVAGGLDSRDQGLGAQGTPPVRWHRSYAPDASRLGPPRDQRERGWPLLDHDP